MQAMSRRHLLQCASATAACALTGPRAQATEAFPAKSLSLVVPYPAGGASDVSARIFAGSIGQSLRQQVVIENFGGGTGLIGVNRLLSASADGYTFIHGSTNEILLVPMLNPAARYKPQDFVLAAPVSETTIVLMARSGISVATLDEFIEYARKSKEKPLTYGTVGVDSMYNLMGDALAARLSVPFLHVPYKGAAPAVQDLAGGQVDFVILPYQASFEGMQRQGLLKLLTSFSRSQPEVLKHVPLISQSKLVPDFEYTVRAGYFLKKGTPTDRVAVLRKAIGEALKKPELRARLEAEGRNLAEPTTSQAQADQAFEQQQARIVQLVKALGRKNLAA